MTKFEDVERRIALVVDPSSRDRTRLAASFGEQWQVSQCADVESAKSILARLCPSLAVIELHLDGGSAFDLAPHVKAIAGCQLVLLSGQLSVAAAVRAHAAGFCLVAAKPNSAPELLAQLARGPRFPAAAPRMTLERAVWEYIWRYTIGLATRKEAAERLGVQARSLRRMLARHAPSK